jgi:hypothetical protein
VLEPFWEVRKPYQPVSDEWSPMVLGVSRAVWVDVDDNGRRDAPLDYATRLVDKAGGSASALAAELAGYDAAVTKHALNVLRARGVALDGPEVRGAFASGSARVRDAYTEFLTDVRASANLQK